MKKYIILLLLVLSYAETIFAQDTFYYCGGKKVLLKKTLVKSAVSAYPNSKGFMHMRKGVRVDAYLSETGDYMETTGSLYVKLRSLDDKGLLADIADKYGLTVVEQNEFLPLWFLLRQNGLVKGNVVELANSIYETDLFAECYPDLAMDGMEISYDAEVGKQWSLFNAGDTCVNSLCVKGVDINVSEAWNYSTGRNVIVAIVDVGIDVAHKDLTSNIHWESYDARNNKSPSTIYGNHGTHCAGIVGAVRNNGLQITGVAPDAKLMSISDDLGIDTEAEYTHSRAIMWAWKHGADVISCSWKCRNSVIVKEAIDSAIVRGRNGKGCVIVKSAGNSGGSISYPGDIYGVIAVGNIKPNGVINEKSSHGENMLVCAPGTDVLSTVPNNGLKVMSGTSMSAPHVAGVAALMLERNPDLTVWQVREIIARTARKLDTMTFTEENEFGLWNEYYGYGLVNALDAVLMSIEYKK